MQQYIVHRDSFKEINDNNFCVPMAVGLLCGIEPRKVAGEMARLGIRKFRDGVRDSDWLDYSKLKGLKLTAVGCMYPKAKTTRSAIRELPNNGRFILVFARHVAALIDGVVEDWTDSRAKRIVDIYEVLEAPDGYKRPAEYTFNKKAKPNRELRNANGWANERVAEARKARWGCRLYSYVGSGSTMQMLFLGEFDSVARAFQYLLCEHVGAQMKDHQKVRRVMVQEGEAYYDTWGGSYRFDRVAKK